MSGHHSTQVMEVSFQDWDVAMRQRNSTFKVFEFLFQHLEHEALEIYDNWSNHITNQAYFMDLTHGAHE